MAFGSWAAVMSNKPRKKKQIPWSEMEGEPFSLAEMQQMASTAREVYRKISKIVREPAPPLQTLGDKLPC